MQSHLCERSLLTSYFFNKVGQDCGARISCTCPILLRAYGISPGIGCFRLVAGGSNRDSAWAKNGFQARESGPAVWLRYPLFRCLIDRDWRFFEFVLLELDNCIDMSILIDMKYKENTRIIKRSSYAAIKVPPPPSVTPSPGPQWICPLPLPLQVQKMAGN